MQQESYWWYITLEATRGNEEVLSSLVEMAGCLGCEEADKGDKACLRAYFHPEKPLEHWLMSVSSLAENWPGVTVADMGKIDNQPWHKEWMEAFPPLNVGHNLVVMASWHADAYQPSGRVPLYIHPGSAFGTGYHESTQAALTLIERHLKPGSRVADIGCGTAILSIAALKLGATSVRARDLDPEAVSEALRNSMELNDITSQQLTVEQGNLLVGFDEQVDLIVANILYEPLCAMVSDVKRCLKPEGIAIFSGMIEREADAFEVKLKGQGFDVFDRVQLADWVALAAKPCN